MQDVSEIFRGSGFKVFARILETSAKSAVWAIPAPRGGSRAFCDRMNSWAQGEGQPGLGYIIFEDVPSDRMIQSDNQLSPEELRKNFGSSSIRQENLSWEGTRRQQRGPRQDGSNSCVARVDAGDAVFFVAGEPQTFVKFAGAARTKIAEDLGSIDKDRFELCWIVDFPMYEWNEEEKKIDFSHNPFSMPNLPAEEFLALDAG